MAVTLPSVHDADAALRLLDRLERHLHVGLVGAGDDDVVAVVADRGADSAAFQPEILAAGRGRRCRRFAVPLDHRDEAEAVPVEMRLPVIGRFERRP